MKKKMFLFVLCGVLLLGLTGCGSNEANKGEYTNIAYEKLKTYTDITSIEANDYSEEVGEMRYTYQVNNKDDQNIDKYQDYLIEYGFTFNTEKSNESREYYDYKGSTIIFEIEKQNNNTFLILHIPLDQDYLEKNIEKKYNEAIKYIESEEYRTARNILFAIRNTNGYDSYKDSQKAIAYANGMIYKKSNIYGSAIKSFNNAIDYKDANIQKEEILKLVSKYEGTWYYDNPKIPNKGLGYYIFIKDGMVSLNFESSYKNGVAASYSSSLAMKHNDENSLDEIFIVSSLVGLDKDITIDDYDYLLYQLEDGGLVVSGRHAASTDYYTGIYDRISKDSPNSK